jgi:hypothetical protein
MALKEWSEFYMLADLYRSHSNHVRHLTRYKKSAAPLFAE